MKGKEINVRIKENDHPHLFHAFEEGFLLSKRKTYLEFLADLVSFRLSGDGIAKDLIDALQKDASKPGASPLTMRIKLAIDSALGDLGALVGEEKENGETV